MQDLRPTMSLYFILGSRRDGMGFSGCFALQHFWNVTFKESMVRNFHIVWRESLNSGKTHDDTQALSGLAPAAAVDVTVKPAPGARGEKFSSSVTVTSPHVNKGESAKLLGPPKAAGLQFPHEITTDYSVQQSKSVLEPVSSVSPSISIKNTSATSASVSAQKLPSSNYSSSVVP
ncbi:hypothetical protein C5167_039990 [Papaver somniferum]|uniref:Uncharacterized protein n=1 Tax=Papaver somniferum TaxID=3469 RepID=A0A4Y7IDN7_PAPSO|nr:hypothetical protein C5167_039990 [Papaver somniferum]